MPEYYPFGLNYQSTVGPTYLGTNYPVSNQWITLTNTTGFTGYQPGTTGYQPVSIYQPGTVYISSAQVPAPPTPPILRDTVRFISDPVFTASDSEEYLELIYAEVQRQVLERINQYMSTDSPWRGWVTHLTESDEPATDTRRIDWIASPTTQDPTADVWLGWQQGSGPITRTPPRKTATELRRKRQETERSRMIFRNRNRATELRQKLVARRAERLLRSVLTAKQNKSLTEQQGFEAKGSDGGRYWISVGRTGNVYSLDKYRKRRERFCIHEPGHMPHHDTMLSQLLLLQHDEKRFRQIANISVVAA